MEKKDSLTFVVNHLSDLPQVALKILRQIDTAKIVAFEGEMGAGKTTLITQILSQMGVENFMGSPTYALVNTYNTQKYGKIHHFDLYRLNSEKEVLDIGIEEMLFNNEYCFIEWPIRIINLLPNNTIWVKISTLENNSRKILVS